MASGAEMKACTALCATALQSPAYAAFPIVRSNSSALLG